MSEEQDSWFQDAFGLDLGQAAQKIKDEAAAAADQAAGTVMRVVQGVQGVVDEALDEVTGAVTAAAKKVAGAAGIGPAGGGGASGGGSGSFPLGGSVGRGGRNAPGDVRAVQSALGIGVDGQCGGQTIAAIEAFQRNTMGVARPDGRVDAGGATERALAGGARPSLANKISALPGAAGSGGSSAEPAIVDPASLDYQRGYQDGVNGGDRDPGPLSPDAIANYNAGYEAGAEVQRRQSGERSDDYQAGYRHGLSGEQPFPGPRIGPALDEYREGYERGSSIRTRALQADADERERQELEEMLPMSRVTNFVIEKVVIRGVVYGVTKALRIGVGLFALIVSTVGGMKCDTKVYRFRCATCGEQEDVCTEEEVRSAAAGHGAKHPDHAIEIGGPSLSQ